MPRLEEQHSEADVFILRVSPYHRYLVSTPLPLIPEAADPRTRQNLDAGTCGVRVLGSKEFYRVNTRDSHTRKGVGVRYATRLEHAA